MPQNFVPKRQDIAGVLVTCATNILQAISDLQQAQANLVQSGGQFQDTDFEGTNFPWMNAYNADVLLNVYLPDLVAFQQAGTPKHDDVVRSIAKGT